MAAREMALQMINTAMHTYSAMAGDARPDCFACLEGFDVKRQTIVFVGS